MKRSLTCSQPALYHSVAKCGILRCSIRYKMMWMGKYLIPSFSVIYPYIISQLFLGDWRFLFFYWYQRWSSLLLFQDKRVVIVEGFRMTMNRTTEFCRADKKHKPLHHHQQYADTDTSEYRSWGDWIVLSVILNLLYTITPQQRITRDWCHRWLIPNTLHYRIKRITRFWGLKIYERCNRTTLY